MNQDLYASLFFRFPSSSVLHKHSPPVLLFLVCDASEAFPLDQSMGTADVLRQLWTRGFSLLLWLWRSSGLHRRAAEKLPAWREKAACSLKQWEVHTGGADAHRGNGGIWTPPEEMTKPSRQDGSHHPDYQLGSSAARFSDGKWRQRSPLRRESL